MNHHGMVASVFKKQRFFFEKRSKKLSLFDAWHQIRTS